MTKNQTKRRFAAFDIDGTIFRWQLFHELIFELIEQGSLPVGIKEKVAQPLQAWHHRSHPNAYKTYEDALVEALSDNLAGVSAELFDAASEAIVARSGDRVYRYTRDLLHSLKQEGHVLLAVSGSFHEPVELFARKFGFDDWHGARFSRKNGKLSGQVDWAHDRKGKILQDLVAKNNLSWQGSIAVGDTPSDIPMLELVEQPIAFNPNQQLFDHARQHGWKIVVERKNVAYELTPGKTGTYGLQS